jgi:hypothetical protein
LIALFPREKGDVPSVPLLPLLFIDSETGKGETFDVYLPVFEKGLKSKKIPRDVRRNRNLR